MPKRLFSVELKVNPISGGDAELVLPKALKGLNYDFIIVKDGCEEGIIKLTESESVLKKIEKDKACRKLSVDQTKKLKSSYPRPKLKNKYRMRELTQESREKELSDDRFEVDKRGNRIVDTFQTVRSGFYLIDVPIVEP